MSDDVATVAPFTVTVDAAVPVPSPKTSLNKSVVTSTSMSVASPLITEVVTVRLFRTSNVATAWADDGASATAPSRLTHNAERRAKRK